MLKKKERLSREAFNRSFSLGKRFHSPSFTLIHNPKEKELAVAAVVSKKIAKKAVTRNKIRRRVYNSIRTIMQERVQGGHFIFLVKPQVLERSHQEFVEEIRSLVCKV